MTKRLFAKKRNRFSFLGFVWRLVILAGLAWTGGFAVFLLTLPVEVDAANAPQVNGIVVLTGGPGRISAGVLALETHPGSRMLVSGANRSVAEETLYAAITDDQNLIACCIDLGYEAENTIGNAREALKWAHQNNFTSLLVVSSRVHMRRTLLAFETEKVPITLYALPVDSDDSVAGMALEYTKYLIALARGIIGL